MAVAPLDTVFCKTDTELDNRFRIIPDRVELMLGCSQRLLEPVFRTLIHLNELVILDLNERTDVMSFRQQQAVHSNRCKTRLWVLNTLLDEYFLVGWLLWRLVNSHFLSFFSLLFDLSLQILDLLRQCVLLIEQPVEFLFVFFVKNFVLLDFLLQLMNSFL